MTKPSGLLCYPGDDTDIGINSGATLSKDCFADLDGAGNVFGGDIPSSCVVEAYWVSTGAGDQKMPGIQITKVGSGGKLTGLTVTVDNSGAGQGENISGRVCVRINHNENMAL